MRSAIRRERLSNACTHASVARRPAANTAAPRNGLRVPREALCLCLAAGRLTKLVGDTLRLLDDILGAALRTINEGVPSRTHPLVLALRGRGKQCGSPSNR